MINVAQLQRDFEKKQKDACALVDSTIHTAEAENRAVTADEKAAIDAMSADVRALDARITSLTGSDAVRQELQRLGGGRPADGGTLALTAPGRMLSLGEQFVAAKEYDFFKQGQHRSASTWRSPSMELDPHWAARFGGLGVRAATLTSDPASGGPLITPQYLPGVLPLQFVRPVVADLLASGTTDSNLVAYMREKLFTNAAAAVLEGGVKPESTLTFEAASAPVRKLAHWLPVTEEMLEDVAQIRSYIDARLVLGIQIEEEDQLLNGDGVAPNLLGLRPQATAPDVARGAAESNMDAILRQIMAIYGTSFLMPDSIVMNPADWTQVLLTKGAQGQYLTAGPFQSIQSNTLWGVSVVTTPVMAATVALVGALKTAAQVFRKGGIRVEASNSHVDFFIKNLVAIRAEERLALAVYRPAAIGEVTGLGVPV